MFTGLIKQKGRVAFLERGEVLLYGLDFPHEGLEIGASVSIDGICQTVVSLDGVVFFEAVEETLKRTTLGEIQIGDELNMERSARFGDEIGGHLLSGHVMTTATISQVEGNIYTFSVPHTRYLFEKGFVAIDGMSLTVVAVSETNFTVHLIPETLKWLKKGVGDLVNIEYDAMTVATVETVNRLR